MSSPPAIEPFKGTNWEECNSFICAIRAAAWREGKPRDNTWVADFAALHFSHKALTWHSRLPQDVREDWAKLQLALLERWTPPEDDDEHCIEPTPAAAQQLNRRDRADHSLQGVLKVIDGSDTNFYFTLNHATVGVMTNNANEALRVRCCSISNTTLLERIDGPRHSWLAIQWLSSNPNLKKESTDFALLVFVDSLTLRTYFHPDYLYQLASCTLSTEDEVFLFWESHDTSKIALAFFHDDHGTLSIAADPDAFLRMHPSATRVRIFIEPID